MKELKEEKEYLLSIGFDDAHLPDLFNDEDKSYYTIPELMNDFHLSKSKEKDEWISVNDRLPENTDKDSSGFPLNFSEEILTFGDGIISVGFYDFELKKWLYSSDESIENVTHWMELPEQPKNR